MAHDDEGAPRGVPDLARCCDAAAASQKGKLPRDRLGRPIPELGYRDVWATNDTLAMCGGECSEKTIRREIKQYCDLGIFLVEHGWRKAPTGEFRRTRTVRLSIPKLLESHDHMDTSGPHELQNHMDHCRPKVPDTSGPFTFEESLKATGEVEANQIGFGGKEPAAAVCSHQSPAAPSGNVSRLAHRREPSADELAAFEAVWRSSQKTGGNP
jgi:hypothetical protein